MEIETTLKTFLNDRTVVFIYQFVNRSLVGCVQSFNLIQEKAATVNYEQFQFICYQICELVIKFMSYLIGLLVDPFVVSLYYIRSYVKSLTIAVIVAACFLPFVIIYKSSSGKRKEKALIQCFREMAALIHSKDCHPILLRLAWSDAGSYDQSIKVWPQCGGTNGSVRFDREIAHTSNAGLSKALQYLRPLHKAYHAYISWADLIQMAGALAVELSGGPSMQDKMLYGRKDAPIPKKLPNKTGAFVDQDMQTNNANGKNSSMVHRHHHRLNVPAAAAIKPGLSPYRATSSNQLMKGSFKPTPVKTSSNVPNPNSECLASRLPVSDPPYPYGVPTAEAHLRHTFYRMGFKNKEIVALCGAHTLGRAFKDRSGVCEYASGDVNATMYTKQNSIAKARGRPGIGMAGGCSWTKNWLQFDNSYFQRIHTLLKKNDTESSDPSSTAASSGPLNSRHKAQVSMQTPVATEEGKDDVLLWLATDWALYNSSEFRPHFLRYASDQNAFFEDYSDAHKKMSELGAKFDPPEGVRLPFIDISEYINS